MRPWSRLAWEWETSMRYLLFLCTLGGARAQPPANFTAPPFYNHTVADLSSERLPSWLKLSGEFRTRVEGRTGFNYQPDNNDAYALFRTRLNVELLPTPWLDFYFQGQDSRVPGMDAGRPLTNFK